VRDFCLKLLPAAARRRDAAASGEAKGKTGPKPGALGRIKRSVTAGKDQKFYERRAAKLGSERPAGASADMP